MLLSAGGGAYFFSIALKLNKPPMDVELAAVIGKLQFIKTCLDFLAVISRGAIEQFFWLASRSL